MVENLKINKPLASLSGTNIVKRVRHRQYNNQQNLFKKQFEEKHKKKKNKEVTLQTMVSGRGAAVIKAQHRQHSVKNKKSKAFTNKSIIDIRV